MSGSRLRTPSAEEVNNVAVIAAWCESPAHLAHTPVSTYLSHSGHRQLCTVVASRWNPFSHTPSGDLEALLDGDASTDAGTPPSGATSQLTPEELSQRSVDLLLRTYYQMVKDNRRAATAKRGAAGPNALQKVFLLLCRPLPMTLRDVYKALAALLVALAYVLAVLSFIFIPAWLALVRYFAMAGLWRQAAAAAVYGLLAFLAADHIHRAAETGRRQRRKGAVSPSNVAAVLQDAARSYYESPLTLSGANSSSHNPSAPGAYAASSSSAATLARLRPDLEALQRVVYGSSASMPSGQLSEASMAAELRKICKTVGVEFKPNMAGSADALAKTVRELRKRLGV